MIHAVVYSAKRLLHEIWIRATNPKFGFVRPDGIRSGGFEYSRPALVQNIKMVALRLIFPLYFRWLCLFL